MLLRSAEHRNKCELLAPFITNINATNESAQTMLMEVCLDADYSLEAVAMLLKMGANVNAQLGAHRRASPWQPEFPRSGESFSSSRQNRCGR